MHRIAKEQKMPKGQNAEHVISKTANREDGHEAHEKPEHLGDEEKILAGHLDVNMTSVLTKDALGG
jgi:hypothetical protein